MIPTDAFVDQLSLPKDYHDAVTGPYRNYWIPAIAEEMQNLRHFKVRDRYNDYHKALLLSEGSLFSNGRQMNTTT